MTADLGSIGACLFGVDRLVLTPNGAQALLECPDQFEGGPNVAHGGWVAAAIDSACGRTLRGMGLAVVTATLTINYRLPVPMRQPLELDVRLARREGRKCWMAVELKLEGRADVLASAEGLWIERRVDHFERHALWLEDNK